MTTRAEQNLAVLEGYFAAMQAGGPPAAMPFYAESVVLDVPGGHPASGRYEGHDGIRAFGAAMAKLTGGTFRLKPLDLLASDEHVVTYAQASAEVAGTTLQWTRVIVSTVHGGKLSTLRFFESDEARVTAFLSARDRSAS